MGHERKDASSLDGAKDTELHSPSPELVQGAETESGAQPGKELKRARRRVAWIFDDEIERLWKKNQSCSRRLLADKYVRTTESTVRKWCDDDKPIPLAALLLLPEEFAIAVVRKIFAERGVKL
jgi:hypothetical protein